MTDAGFNTKEMKSKPDHPAFDYMTLRMLMGVIAFSLPLIVWAIAGMKQPSISHYYYTEARDVFVGMLFIVAAFMLSYNGHAWWHLILSKIASAGAVMVAVFPTAEVGVDQSWESMFHYIGAGLLFGILCIFCFYVFQKKDEKETNMRKIRRKIYKICGSVMLISIVTILLATKLFPGPFVDESRVVFYCESAALFAFGVAWFVSGKALLLFSDSNEQNKSLHIYKNKLDV